MKKLLVLAVFSALLVSGCIGQGTSTTTVVGEPTGVEITDFSVEPDAVFSGRTTRVIMNVKNVGGANMLMDENISRAAGAAHGRRVGAQEMEEAIRRAGRVPARRSTLYEPLSDGAQAGGTTGSSSAPRPDTR